MRPVDRCFSSAPGIDPTVVRIVRPVRPDELETCAGIWRDALNDYLGRLGQPEIPDDLVPILRLYAHLRATDPETFLVADARRARRRLRRRAAAGRASGSSRCCSSGPGRRPGGLGRPLLAAVSPGDALDRRPGDRDGQRPADLERAVRLARDRAADPAPPSGRPGRSPAELPRCPTASRRSGSTRWRRRGRPARAALLAELTALDRDAAGFAAPWTTRSSRARPGSASCSGTATAASSATATPRSPAGSVPLPSATRRSWRP